MCNLLQYMGGGVTALLPLYETPGGTSIYHPGTLESEVMFLGLQLLQYI